MANSPCYKCPKCPCKEHDTCEEYQEFRAEKDRILKKKATEAMLEDYSCRSYDRVAKMTRRKQRK